MKKLSKLFNFHSYSLLTKILGSSILFIIFFILIKIALTNTKIENTNLNNEINYITRSLLITKEQIRIIGKSLQMQTELEIDLTKKTIENITKDIALKINNQTLKEEIIDLFKKSAITNYCSYKISNDIFINDNSKKDDYFDKNNTSILEDWQTVKIEDKDKSFSSKDYFFYNYKIKNIDLLVEIGCNKSFLNLNHMGFEMDLKKHLHHDLLIDSALNDTKIAIFWINPNIIEDLDSVFFEEDEIAKKNKYTISMLSNVENIPTGNLTLRQILEQKNTNEPITHTIDGKEVLTWIIDVGSTRQLLLAYTIDKKSIEDKNNSEIFFLLPETLLAISISFLLMLFLFRRILENINTLTKTAIKVNKGEKNIRSNVKGDDDIGILGKSFDSMLDLLENNIKILDEKVEEKTKEITKSLEEKEILLKEIHHRVKNNLALTISLIELQEEEIEDDKTKKVLIDITERIYTMELLHRKLYESTNLNKIPFKSYVMDLIETISKTYDKEKNVEIQISIENIDLNIETAMPYGIILNELITNAFKYAFLNQNEPKLDITISKQNDEDILLIIKDNGKGLSKDFSKLSNETLGLRLINMIVNFQLMGKVTYEFESGAKFTILGRIKE